MDEIDQRIVNALQGGFPVCERPFQAAAEELWMNEAELIARIERMLADGMLTRFGPLYNADRMGGGNVLAAMAVPEARYEEVTETVNAQPEIAHNYRREHELNMWFVGASDSPEAIEAAFRRIEEETGLPVYRFPKEREFFVEFKVAI
ncbi:MAG: AsnC family transcriptional regulator [Betaproteobacteria bacterium]|nr:AsnC family transcriptional regulator [Betaproteobacteria bacterium]